MGMNKDGELEADEQLIRELVVTDVAAMYKCHKLSYFTCKND